MSGVQITGKIVPLNGASFPVFDDINGEGGFRAVADDTERDDIPANFRKIGMVVANQATNVSYQLQGGISNADWAVFGNSFTVAVAGALAISGTTVQTVRTVGGFLSGISDLTVRDAIPANQRNEGTTTYVVDTGRMYRLEGGIANANWVDVTVELVSNAAAGLVPQVGAANQVLQSTGTAAQWNAALSLGATPGSTGQVNLTAGLSIVSKRVVGGGDLTVYSSTSNTNDVQRFGDTTNSTTVIQSGSSGGAGIQLAPGGNQAMSIAPLFVAFVTATELQFSAQGANSQPPIIHSLSTSTVQGSDQTLRAQGSTHAASSGGIVRIQGGVPGTGSRLRGAALQLNVDDTIANMQNLVEATEVVAGRRVLALCRTADVTATELPANSGDLVIYLGNAATAPTAAPASGLVYFASGGNPGWFTPNATKTTIGAAGPASVLPLTPTEYMPIVFNGNQRAIPLYTP